MFKGNYNEEKEALYITLTTKGALLLCGMMWVICGGSAIVFFLDGSLGYILYGILVIIGAIAYSIWAYVCLQESYEITREGVSVCKGTKVLKSLRWDECTFVYVCRKSNKNHIGNLMCSICTVPWAGTHLPMGFTWPDETIEVPWFSLTKEQQAIVLEFCGGMRGGPQ